jgi:predicted DNA-binding transcriptional regulator YafY
MNRTDRLYALVEQLRARSPRPMRAAELADRFEVSVRTIERDLLALQEAGVPIWARRGPRGGYSLDRRHTLPPLNLSAAEATALSVAIAHSGSMPLAEAGRSAMRKLLAVMPAEEVHAAERLAERVHVQQREGLAPELSRAIDEAVEQTAVLHLSYEDRHGAHTERDVEVHGVAGGPKGWYLVGWCRNRNAARMFRLDRIRAAVPTGERAPPREIADVVGDAPRSQATPEWRVSQIVLGVAADRMEEAFAFWRDVLGFPVSEDYRPHYVSFRAGAVSVALELQPVTPPCVLRLASADVDAAYEELVGRGATFDAPPADDDVRTMRVATLRDPAGHILELFSYASALR